MVIKIRIQTFRSKIEKISNESGIYGDKKNKIRKKFVSVLSTLNEKIYFLHTVMSCLVSVVFVSPFNVLRIKTLFLPSWEKSLYLYGMCTQKVISYYGNSWHC